jgi:hypothetical protein
VAHHVGDLVEFPVVHLEKGMEYTPLYGLKAVLKIGNSPVPDYIGSVFQKVLVE